MKKLYGLLALLLLLPCAALAGGSEPQENAEKRIYFTAPSVVEEFSPKTRLSPLETVPPEQTVYPCTAVADAPHGGTVPLYEKPDGASRVLMNYYRGARVTVLRGAMQGFFLVQTGAKEAGLMGYMRGEDLAFGSAALREIQPEFVKIQFNRGAVIRRYCDALAEEIGACTTQGEYFTVGKNDDKWVQIIAPVGMDIESADAPLVYTCVQAGEGDPIGFVQLETGMARGYEATAWRWDVQPIPGEITKRQAVELAIWWMMNAEGGIPPELRSESTLRSLPYTVEWRCSPSGSGYIGLAITVSYACDEYSITVGLYPDGKIRYGRYEEAAEGS